ncbi:MAG: ATP-binding protein [Candidatus Schekmanbacteria bacterium]|nr:MAG: ATP-binding protein [Candidatus Schekmanbacteria bacterium]
MAVAKKFIVPPSKLRWQCKLKGSNFKGIEKLEPPEGTIGQDRAIKALKLGLELYGQGYNVFVTGLTGTGRRTAVRKILEKINPHCNESYDRLYVYNFSSPDHPRLITLPVGKGKKFAKSMSRFITYLKKNLSKILDAEDIVKKKQAVAKSYQEEERKIVTVFEEKVKKNGFVIGQVQVGEITVPDILLLVDDKAYPFANAEALIAEGKLARNKYESMQKIYEDLKNDLRKIYKKVNSLNLEMVEKLKDVERESCINLIDSFLEDIKEDFKEERVSNYLDEVRESILEEIEIFKSAGEKKIQLDGTISSPFDDQIANPFVKYEVNLLIDNSKQKKCPIIIESSPTVATLFGTIEKEMTRTGAIYSDFTKIKPGSLLRADGGYLVLNASDVFMDPQVWTLLKRVLKTGQLEILPPSSFFQVESLAIKPEPIDVNVKVIMIGEADIYEILYNYEDDFKKIFKIKAEFDSRMNLTDRNIKLFLSVIAKVCKEKELAGIRTDALERVIEYGVRRAGGRKKLTTRFSEIEDILLQADYWRKQSGDKMIAESHIEEAINSAIERHNLTEMRLREMIEKGIIIIDVDGYKVGEVNGLAVYNMGAYSFGKPSKITAAVSVGRQGVVNIEREAKLSGNTHDKGILILTGYLQEKYAQDLPLNLYASICFEQSYSGIDGDSASSTELYALLSALSGIPINQGIAVTGSVNQKGVIQPIGGVNEKIEGYYDICKIKGLTGNQGVMIPVQNIDDLMLKNEIVEDVKDGKFHIYAVSHIEEGIEILTGMKAGKIKKDGNFPKNTINYLVKEKLLKFSRAAMPPENKRSL